MYSLLSKKLFLQPNVAEGVCYHREWPLQEFTNTGSGHCRSLSTAGVCPLQPEVVGANSNNGGLREATAMQDTVRLFLMCRIVLICIVFIF